MQGVKGQDVDQERKGGYLDDNGNSGWVDYVSPSIQW